VCQRNVSSFDSEENTGSASEVTVDTAASVTNHHGTEGQEAREDGISSIANDDDEFLRLPSGPLVDAKNTCQSHSVVISADSATTAVSTAENDSIPCMENVFDNENLVHSRKIASADASRAHLGTSESRANGHCHDSDSVQRDLLPNTIAVPPSEQSAAFVSMLSTTVSADLAATVVSSLPPPPPFATACLVDEGVSQLPPPIQVCADADQVVITVEAVTDTVTAKSADEITNKRRFRRMVGVLASFTIFLLAILLVIPTQVQKANHRASNNTVSSINATQDIFENRTRVLLDFFNTRTLTGRILANNNTTDDDDASFDMEMLHGEELAVQYLVYADSLQLWPHDGLSRFRLVQRYALLTIRFQQSLTADWPSANSGKNGKNATWLQAMDECDWEGVTCETDPDGRRTVVELDLLATGLQGTISPDLGLLSSLRRVDLSSGTLAGSLPPSIGQWSLLETLDVSLNQLTGSLPETIGQWLNISFVSVAFNQLVGSLPETVKQWSNLTVIDMSSNQLTGTLPLGMSHWTNAMSISLADNQMRGTLPSTLTSWTQLTQFNVADNKLSGTIPDFVGNWTSLSLLYLGNNTLTGSLPDSLQHLTALNSLDVSNNHLTGTITVSMFGDWSNVTFALLQGNNFTGTIPATICGTGPMGMYLLVDCLLKAQCSCCLCVRTKSNEF
jgi:Leucine rich repeat